MRANIAVLGGDPFFQRPFSCKGTEFPLPNLAEENNSQVGSAEVFSGPVGNASLSYLGYVVLGVHVRDSAFRCVPKILSATAATVATTASAWRHLL